MRAAPFVVALTALLAAGSACGDDGGPTFSDDVSDAEIAGAACGVLVTWTDDVATIVNDAEGRMVGGGDLPALMLEAVDEVIERTEVLAGELEGLEFPDTDGGRTLAGALQDGQEAAAEDLEGFRDEIEAIPDPDPESDNYRKSQLVVEIERPRSLVKPDISGDLGDPDLEAAFAAEGSCLHVTRQ